MAYLGNDTIQQQYVNVAPDVFSGTGSLLTFTLSRPVGSSADITVYVENVPQQPEVAYTATGQTLTLTGAPPLGTNNIYVVYKASINSAFIPQGKSILPGHLSPGGPTWDINGNLTTTNILSGASLGLGTQTPVGVLDVAGSALNTVQAVLTRGNGDQNFQLRVLNSAGTGTGSTQAELGLFYNGVGPAATMKFYRGASTSDGSIGFLTNNGTLQTQIDSAGRVTMPNQPAFAAQGAPTTNASGNLVFAGTPYWNVGGHYNNSNGRFTAPVAGLYFFYYHQLLPFADAAEFRIEFVKNGGSLNGNRFIFYKTQTNTWMTIQCTSTFLLAAGDYIAPSYTSGPNPLYTDAGYAGFEGYLIR